MAIADESIELFGDPRLTAQLPGSFLGSPAAEPGTGDRR